MAKWNVYQEDYISLLSTAMTTNLPMFLIIPGIWATSLQIWCLKQQICYVSTSQFASPLLFLRTFALIVSAHPYCARKFTFHVIHRACALNTRTIIGQMAIVIALLGFNDLGRSMTPTFLFRNRFYVHLSPHCPNMNKKSMWEVKKISGFLSLCPRDMESCHLGAARRGETMVTKSEVVLWVPSPVD